MADEEVAQIEGIQLEKIYTNESGINSHGDDELKGGREDFDYQPEVSINGISRFWTSICRVELGPPTHHTAQDKAHWGSLAPFFAWLDNTFRISDRRSTLLTEIVGGFTTFFTIAYVLTANPHILAGTGIPANGAFFANALASGVFTTVMGVVTNLPITVGPSLGLNVYFSEIAQTCANNPTGELNGPLCESWGKTSLPWSDALGAVYISGWLYLALTVTGFRGFLYDAFPKSFRHAIAVGTGFYLTYQGLKIGGITRVTIQPEYVNAMYTAAACVGDSCANSVDLAARWYNLGIVRFNDVPAARIAIIGLVSVAILELYKIRGSLIIAIWIATFIGINYYECVSTDKGLYSDDFVHPCVTHLEIWSGNPYKIPFLVDWSHNPAGKLSFKFANTAFFWETVWTFLFFEIFDSYGAIEHIVNRMGLTNNHPTVAMDRVNRAMFVDGVSVWIGAIMGTNSLNVYVESATAVEVGARTGLSAFVTGSLLLLCLFFVFPFVAVIPPAATTCALVVVGVYSLTEWNKIDFKDYILRITCFFTIAVMGFTYSISNGISVGMIFYCWLQVLAVIFQKAGIANVEEIRPGTKVALPHPFIILMAVFAACRFCYLNRQ